MSKINLQDTREKLHVSVNLNQTELHFCEKYIILIYICVVLTAQLINFHFECEHYQNGIKLSSNKKWIRPLLNFYKTRKTYHIASTQNTTKTTTTPSSSSSSSSCILCSQTLPLLKRSNIVKNINVIYMT